MYHRVYATLSDVRMAKAFNEDEMSSRMLPLPNGDVLVNVPPYETEACRRLTGLRHELKTDDPTRFVFRDLYGTRYIWKPEREEVPFLSSHGRG